MRDLCQFNDIPLALGPAKKQAPKPTAAEMKAAEFRRFEAMSDKPMVTVKFGPYTFLTSGQDTSQQATTAALIEKYRAMVQAEQEELRRFAAMQMAEDSAETSAMREWFTGPSCSI
jgi:hypothetical protein